MKPEKQLSLNFSGAYALEEFFPGEVLDFSCCEGTQCYCDSEAADFLRKSLAPYGFDGMHWIDSGDYHYVTLFFLEMIREPFTLALFDHHPDDQETAFGGDQLSCGSWVAHARRLPMFRGSGSDLPVYISIDKDVLCPEEARTDWDQGDMTLDEMFASIRSIAASHRILGVDVCGELSESKGGTPEDFTINRETNQKILDFFLSLNSKTNI